MGYGNSEEHSFWCINCGKRGIPLSRTTGRQRERFHRKKLYCPNCKVTVNHIECKNSIEIEQFQEEYQAGNFQEEAKESVEECAKNEKNIVFDVRSCGRR